MVTGTVNLNSIKSDYFKQLLLNGVVTEKMKFVNLWEWSSSLAKGYEPLYSCEDE